MRFLPYERITLRSDAPPDVVEAKLAGLVAKPRWFSFARPPEPFVGSVNGRHFNVLRVIRGRNSWQPVIIGDVVPVPGGTEVRVRMRLHIIVAIAMMAFLSPALFVTGRHLIGGQAGDGGYGFAAFWVIALYAMTSFGFWPEVTKARRLLAEGLGCREADTVNRLVR